MQSINFIGAKVSNANSGTQIPFNPFDFLNLVNILCPDQFTIILKFPLLCYCLIHIALCMIRHTDAGIVVFSNDSVEHRP